MTMDLHAGQLQGFFTNPVDHMTAMPLLTQYVKDQLGDAGDLVIVAPDAGRVKLTRKFAGTVGCEYALLEKERPAQQVAEIGYVIGQEKVEGRKAVIVDDIIDTGGTLAAGAQTVLDVFELCRDIGGAVGRLEDHAYVTQAGGFEFNRRGLNLQIV